MFHHPGSRFRKTEKANPADPQGTPRIRRHGQGCRTRRASQHPTVPLEQGILAMVPGGRTIRVWAGLTALILAGCFTEIGHPGKEQAVTAQFRIDYAAESGPVPIGAPTSGNAAPPSGFRWGIASGASDVPASDSVRILQFYMNVVGINYDTSDNARTVIWKE